MNDIIDMILCPHCGRDIVFEVKLEIESYKKYLDKGISK